jgi:hypothetical protein
MHCTTGYCQRRHLQSSLLLLLSKTHFSHAFQRHLFEKSTHNFGTEMEHLFHILHSKYSKLLQRVGIFRVQPGILEVGLVKNTRELGEL